MKNIQFKKGQRVWWNDPAGETSDYFTIVSDVQADIKELQDQYYDIAYFINKVLQIEK